MYPDVGLRIQQRTAGDRISPLHGVSLRFGHDYAPRLHSGCMGHVRFPILVVHAASMRSIAAGLGCRRMPTTAGHCIASAASGTAPMVHHASEGGACWRPPVSLGYFQPQQGDVAVVQDKQSWAARR